MIVSHLAVGMEAICGRLPWPISLPETPKFNMWKLDLI